MTLPILLGGILLAAAIFGATLYSAAQAIRSTKTLRFTHIALILATLAGMTAIQFLAPLPAAAAGLALIAAGATAAALEKGASKLLPLIQLIFGIVLATGLPFAP